MIFPTLYKRTATGAVQQWTIEVGQPFAGEAIIQTTHGQVGGAQQTTRDTVRFGKNVGKKNETTALQQAEAEAHAKHTKKKEREGYVEDLARAQAGETDQEGGIAPMLAKSWEDVEKKFKFPADAQRKLDGVRCVAVIENGQVTLWSRKRAPITGVPHVVAALEKLFGGPGARLVLDGELFVLGMGFQKITSFVRQQTPKAGHEQLEYHVYDVPDVGIGEHRWSERLLSLETLPDTGTVKKVPTVSVSSYTEACVLHDQWVQEGYEGLMLRSRDGLYKGKRSSDLIKVKRFQEDEFKIVAVGAGRGKFEGKAVFTCLTDDGKAFDCCAPGTLEERAEYFKNGSKLLGLNLTVKYFEKTEDGLPRFPVGKAIRDYE